MNEKVLFMWLSLAVKPGGTSFKKLYERYKDISVIYELERDDYIRTITSKSSDLDALCDKSLDRAEEIISYCEQKGIGIIYYFEDRYPNLLREIKNPPVLLYFRGNPPDFNTEFFTAVVGTRLLSDYGRRFSFTLAHDLAYAGSVIVSGMAIGIDGVAHAGAIAAGGVTVAVLGCGINVCYPEIHQNLAREIVKSGCVITEYPPNTPPKGDHFPVRNRIISGLCRAVIVIEGKESSGALLTARHAREQGRKIYALPGNVGNKNSEVGNILIRNGAKLILVAEDVIDDFDFICGGKLNRFLLPNMPKPDMNDWLYKLKVSCVAPSDGIFKGTKGSPGLPARKKELPKEPSEKKPRSMPNSGTSEDDEKSKSERESAQKAQEQTVASFDAETLKIYKSIPTEGDCSIESLCKDGFTIKQILRILFKLDALHCIEMLPQERVRRRIKF